MNETTQPAVAGPVEPTVRPDAPSLRRILRAKRLTEELGHGDDTIAALEHMKRMQTALRIISTWASFPPLSESQVKRACMDALLATWRRAHATHRHDDRACVWLAQGRPEREPAGGEGRSIEREAEHCFAAVGPANNRGCVRGSGGVS